MFEEHARALRYLAWFAAGLFPFGIIIERLKQGGTEPLRKRNFSSLRIDWEGAGFCW